MEIGMVDEKRFEEVKNNYISSQKERSGIGTLKEKTVHGILKDYYAPGKEMQEIFVNGYIALFFKSSPNRKCNKFFSPSVNSSNTSSI